MMSTIYAVYLTLYSLSISAMPKSYRKLQSPPDQPIKDWLTWTQALFKKLISDESTNKIAGIMGINKAGDIQSLYMPIIVPKAFADSADTPAIIVNVFDMHSEPSFIFTNASDIGSVSGIETIGEVLSNPSFLSIRHG